MDGGNSNLEMFCDVAFLSFWYGIPGIQCCQLWEIFAISTIKLAMCKDKPHSIMIFIESVTLAMLLATNSTTASSVMFGKSFLHTFFSIIGKNCVIFCSLSGGPFVVLVNCCFCWDSIHCVSIRFQCQWSVNTHILIDVPPGGEVKEETEFFFLWLLCQLWNVKNL